MKRKNGFTLVEMLIVIVIIGILSSALLPRLSGYMARTRDTKRQMDLKNVAAAIEMYRDQKGAMPERGRKDRTENTRGTLQASNCGQEKYSFENILSEYISPLPYDPIKNNMIKIHSLSLSNNWFFGTQICSKQGVAAQPGQYFYQIFNKMGILKGGAVLIAKVETPDIANYVLSYDGIRLNGGLRNTNAQYDLNDLYLCDSIIQVKKGEESSATKNNTQCSYSSADQLYYIVKIE